MQKIIALLCFAVVALKTSAQNESCQITLSGKVLDATTGNSIEDATIFIKEQQKGSHTLVNGEYMITGLCEGTYTLICQHLNHEAKQETILLKGDHVKRTIYMTCHTDSLHQLIVKGAKLHWEDITVVNKVQGVDLFQSSGLSIGKALEKVNGVYNLSTGNNINKPVIRGMHSNRVLILNNEIRQEGQQWGNEHAPEIDQFIAKSIEVVKGAQTIRYGSDIIGGLILVNPNPLSEIKGVQGEINLASFTNGRSGAVSALIEGRDKVWKGFSWRAQGTYKQAGNAKTPTYYLKNTGMRELNYSLGAGYQNKKFDIELFHSYFNTDIAIFAGSHIGNLTDLYNAFNATQPIDSAGFSYNIDFPYQDVVHQLNKIKMAYTLDSIGVLKLTYGYQINTRKEFDKNLKTKQDDGTYKPTLHFLLNTHNYDLTFEHNEIRRLTGAIGINGFYQTNNYYGSYFIPNYQKFTGGLFITEKWHMHQFSMEVGARYDINHFNIQKWENNILISPSHRYSGFASTLALRYQFPYITMHLNMGTAWRAPFVNELYSYGVHHSAASFEIGDRTMTRERSYNTALTIDFNYKNKIDGELTFFNTYINDYINLQPVLPATLTIRGAFPTFQYSQTNANFKGIEFSSSIKLNSFARWFVKGNLTLAKDIKNQIYLIGIPPARLESDIDLTLFQKDENKISWSLGASYTFRQNRINDTADYVPSPNAYFLLHTDIQAKYKIAKTNVLINLGISNLLNTQYRDYMNRNRYFANEIGRNIYLRLSIPLELIPTHSTNNEKSNKI